MEDFRKEKEKGQSERRSAYTIAPNPNIRSRSSLQEGNNSNLLITVIVAILIVILFFIMLFIL